MLSSRWRLGEAPMPKEKMRASPSFSLIAVRISSSLPMKPSVRKQT